MLLLELENIKKYFGDRLLFDIEELRINEGERIGIVGVNGCGKTTLMNIITGNQDIDEGKVNIYCDYSYISQFGGEKFKDNAFDIFKRSFSPPLKKSLYSFFPPSLKYP